MKKVIVLNGVAKSGKDTFADYIGDYAKADSIYFEKSSTVDLIKDMLELAGINRYKKTNKDRRLMSDLKDLLTNHSNIPFNNIVEKINLHSGFGIFTVMAREPKSIQEFKNMFGCNCKTVLVKRDLDNIPDNHADKDVNLYDYDLIIDNNGTHKDLDNKANKLYNDLIK